MLASLRMSEEWLSCGYTEAADVWEQRWAAGVYKRNKGLTMKIGELRDRGPA